MKPKRLVVGLTGGIGTGKSAALKAFDRLGAATVSLDQIAKEQARPGREAYKSIVRDFGSCILKSDKTIDRALLGRVVFSDKKARLGLERITHPLILKEMRQLIGKLEGLIIVDVPLLFERKLQRHFDVTVLIACDPHRQLSRIVRRDGLDRAEAGRRVRAQWPMNKKRRLADVVIDNDKTILQLEAKIKSYHEGLSLLLGGHSHGNHH